MIAASSKSIGKTKNGGGRAASRRQPSTTPTSSMKAQHQPDQKSNPALHPSLAAIDQLGALRDERSLSHVIRVLLGGQDDNSRPVLTPAPSSREAQSLWPAGRVKVLTWAELQDQCTDDEFGAIKLGNGVSAVTYLRQWRAAPDSEPVAVAVKVYDLKAARVTRTLHTFAREISALAQVHHPHVVNLLACGLDVAAARAFEVLQLAPLGGLTAMLQRVKPLPLVPGDLSVPCGASTADEQISLSLRERLHMLHQIALGMAAVAAEHASIHTCTDSLSACTSAVHPRVPLLHRDLSTDNVLLCPSADPAWSFHALVADFGQCQPLNDRASVARGACRRYAPEALDQKDSSGRFVYTVACDVFMFGMLCYEVLHGAQTVWKDVPTQIAIEATLAGRRPPILVHIPERVAALISACWAQQPGDRPSFTEAARVLNELCHE